MDCICSHDCDCVQPKSQTKTKRVGRVMVLLLVFGCALVCAGPRTSSTGSMIGSRFGNVSNYFSGIPSTARSSVYNAYLTNNSFNIRNNIGAGAYIVNSSIGTASVLSRLGLFQAG